ncbi:putative dual specificity protein phosphatase DSP8 [Dichanthelium oligosanthes]|uniref:Putative dual specificity protein phosphatase DSP8 n=1 Tax=Dichanthelium oligosanthes TaxID=888268 RepID=A0A1E5UJJ0_9POAL|nr:putative dual specificity protein phosphatase DSP8 [Dichanthelium oligosanthes]
MRIRELRDGLEVEEDEREEEEARDGGEVVAVVRLKAKRALVGAGARVLFYPTLLYNVVRNRFEAEFRWWDHVDQYVLLGAVPFPSDVPRLKQLGVRGVVTLNEPYETLVPTSLYQAVKMFSTLNATHNTRCLSIQSSDPTCSALSYEESSEQSSTLTSRSLSIQSSDEDFSVTSDEESSESSVSDPEVYGYAITEFDSEHFVLPHYRSLLSRPTSPTGCSDTVFITEADLEGYENFTGAGKDDDEVEVVVRHKPIMRKLSCFLGSLKLTSNCEPPPPSRLTEVRAC